MKKVYENNQPSQEHANYKKDERNTLTIDGELFCTPAFEPNYVTNCNGIEEINEISE